VWSRRVAILSVMPEACQHFFTFFTRYYSQTGRRQAGGAYEEGPAFGRRCDPLMPSASSFFGDTASQAADFGEPRSELSLMWRMRASPFHGDNAVTISRRRRKAELRESRASARIFLNLRDDVRSPFSRQSRDAWQDLVESEERCADASRLQPRVAERGPSILLMARPTGVSDLGYSRSLLTHLR